MKKASIIITAPVSLIHALCQVVMPFCTQKIISESVYLKSLKKTVRIYLS